MDQEQELQVVLEVLVPEPQELQAELVLLAQPVRATQVAQVRLAPATQVQPV